VPVTTPPASTVAIIEAQAHEPPIVELAKVVVPPTQTLLVPVMGPITAIDEKEYRRAVNKRHRFFIRKLFVCIIKFVGGVVLRRTNPNKC
jgi:hypothetical protein